MTSVRYVSDVQSAAPAENPHLDAAPIHREVSVLVVDDDAALCLTIRRVLTSNSRTSYNVECTDNSARAIEQIKVHAPDLIITDIYMPVGDGFELLNWLRENSIGIPVLAMSGSGSTPASYYDPLQIAKKLGATAVIDKPFRGMQLVELIDHLLTERLDADGAPPLA